MTKSASKIRTHNLVGVDEVGRGPIAGPVCVGVFLSQKTNINKIIKSGPSDLKDSKKLTKTKREAWLKYLNLCKKENLCDFIVISVSSLEIDKKGINQCIQKAIDTGLKKLLRNCNLLDATILLDGGLNPSLEYKNYKTIIKGDEKEPVIAMASIVAKVTRDNLMTKIATKYPEYGFEKHVGYGTQAHYKAIQNKGITVIHRKTYLKRLFD